MGTNYYTLQGKHIGKRSADGYYCWDCRIPVTYVMIRESEGYSTRNEHYTTHHITKSANFQYTCPKCSLQVTSDDLKENYNPAFVEMGLQKAKLKKKLGIDGASSFGWQVGPDGIGKTKEEIRKNLKRKFFVKDEYEKKIRVKEFLNMIDTCVIHQHESNYSFS